eukprot:15476821-Alexandrium_andersonii.AAC.1
MPLCPTRPMGKGGPPPHRLTEAPSKLPPRRAPYYERRCFCTATCGAAKRRPKSLCQSALAH